MATEYKRLVSGSVLTGSAVTYYTATGVKATRIDKCTITNTTGAPIACTLYLVPSGGTAGASNTVISAKNVAAGETYTCPEVVGHVLAASGFIQALGNGATLMVSGVEFT